MLNLFRLLICICSFSSYATAEHMAIRAPLPWMSQQSVQENLAVDQNIHPTWLHHITEIDRKKSIITLDNGSKWNLGIFYGRDLKKWQIGDEVSIAWSDAGIFLDMLIKNYTRGQYTWSNIEQAPQPDSSTFLYVKNIPNRMTLELNNGTIVSTPYSSMFKNVSVGDVMMTLYGRGMGTKTQYALWNMTNGYILYDLKVN